MVIGLKAVSSNLLKRIIHLLEEKFTRRKDLSYRDIKFVKRELRSIHAALRMVAEVSSDDLDGQVKISANYWREMSYDMEDILDSFAVRVEGVRHADPDGRSSFVKKLAGPFKKDKTGQRIADAIRDIKSTILEVNNKGERYEVDMIPPSHRIDPRFKTLHQDAENLVAMDEVGDKLIGMLTERGDDLSNRQLKIVSLVGGAGLGKTTLASNLFRELSTQFDSKAFVSLSPSPDMKSFFRTMLIELDGKTYSTRSLESWDQPKLVDELKKHLRSKRYLIVIDDIWDKKAWLIIKGAMVENYLGSRIVTTTRKFDIAEQIGGAYKLQPLAYESSRILLYRRISGKDECPSNELAEISHDILKKCGGVPLAIITIASLLAFKSEKEYWYEICHNFIKAVSGETDMASRMRCILLLSYNDLPFHLRTCLLYVSLFPENYVIRRDRLVWMWIAEGFVQETEGHDSLFEVGNSYSDELINSSMVQEINDGTVKHCCVDFMVFSLIGRLSSEENFVTIWDGMHEQRHREGKVRRLSLQKITVGHRTDQATDVCLSQVRSVTAFSCATNPMPPLSRFQVLRVMDLEGTDLQSCNLRHLGNLLQLRYLGLRETLIAELPEEIGNLRMLQVLDLKGTRIKELPSTVCRLRRLLCLYVDDTTRLLHGMGDLTSLEELSEILLINESTGFLKELTRLRVLGVVVQQEVDESLAMESLCRLPSLNWVTASLCSADASGAEAALRRAVDAHPNRPTLRISTVPSQQATEKISNVGFSEIEECSE